ncbi:MAG: sodium:solute symporter family protein [Desulfobacterales bacterium]|nr:sodium:solute symporter family protein [Desulfobacterales bacterium]
MEGDYQYASWVLWGLIIYVIGMLGVGYYASKRVKNTTDYIVAGRRLGTFFTTGTVFATWFGAGPCIAAAGYAYLYGNQGIIIEPWGSALCLLLIGLFFVKLIRRGKFLTVPDFYTKRYGKTMGAVSMAILCMGDIGWLGGLLVGFGAIINYFTGVGLITGIILSTLVVVVYTYLGGMWAVTLTDIFQMCILITGIVVIFFVAMGKLEGGVTSLFSNDAGNNWLGLNQWSFIPTPESAANPEYENAGFFFYTGYYGWFYWLASWAAIGLGSIPSQSLQQRFMAAKDEKTAVKAGLLSSLMYITIAMLPVLMGMMYFQLNPDLTLDQAMNEILVRLAVEYLTPFLAVIFIIALVAAIMSSGDSIILGVAAIAGRNIVGLFKKGVDDASTLRYIRFFVPVVAFGSMCLALYFQALMNLIVLSSALLGVSLFFPMAAGFFWKKANKYGAMVSAVGGAVAWIISYFIYLPMTKEMNTFEGVLDFETAMWDAAYIGSIWGFIASFVLLVVVALLTQKINPPLPLTDMDGNPISAKNFFGFSKRSEEETG